MKKLVIFLIVILLTPVIAYGDQRTVEGTIQGYNCFVLEGKTCPLGGEDPLVATEITFVLVTPDGKYFYYVPNIDRAVMARHVGEPVRIQGDVNTKTNSLKAQSLEAYKDGKWTVVYSPK